jgi:hypothetical protein
LNDWVTRLYTKARESEDEVRVYTIPVSLGTQLTGTGAYLVMRVN